jgi:putative ABC transport system permease protein
MGDVGAVRLVARYDLRRRFGETIAITLLVAFAGAVALASLAGARRSDSALARFNAYSRTSNAELTLRSSPTLAQMRAFTRVPAVAHVATVRTFAIESDLPSLRQLAVGATPDNRLGTVVDRARLIAGRRANPNAIDEVTIGEGLAAQAHVGVGSRLPFHSFTQRQVTAFMHGRDGGRPAGPRFDLHVVGIVRRPLDLGDRGASGGVLILTPAFNRAYRDRMGTFGGPVLRVEARHGDADAARVIAAARRIFGRGIDAQPLGIESEGASNAINVLTVALLVFAGVAAVAGFVAIAIVMSRQMALSAREQPTLRALGSTRAQRGAMTGASAAVIAFSGAALAGVIAIAVSPLLPLGVARRADPDVGVHADWWVLGLGALTIAVVVLGIAAFAAVRTAGTSSSATVRANRGLLSPMIDSSTAAGLSPSATIGLRMAVEPGRGEHAVPLRSAFVGVIVAVLGVTAVTTFASSLTHLASTPHLYGWTWDYKIEDDSAPRCDNTDHGIARDRAVAAFAAVCYANVQLDGRPVTAWTFVPIRGTIDAATVHGRDPRAPHEVALGTVTMHALHKHPGDVVDAVGAGGEARYRIVGRIVLPRLGDPQPLADGAVFTQRGFDRLYDPQGFSRYLVGTYAAGADRAAFERRINAAATRIGPGLGSIDGPAVPVEIDRLRHINWFPPALALLLALLGTVAVGHALFTSVRRRRRDLAVLKTLGFERRHVRRTVAWQATTLALGGLVVGLPLGFLIGKVAWRIVADGLGVTSSSHTSLLALVVVPAAIAALNVVAFFPATAAARQMPAVALHTE